MTDNMHLYEVFIRSRRGLDHKHVGSLHAEDPNRPWNTPAMSTPAAARASVSG